MRSDLFNQYIKGKSILHCAIADFNNIVFSLKEIQSDESDNRAMHERASIILSYSPERLKNQDGYGHLGWSEGHSNLYLAYNDLSEGILACDTDFYVYESKGGSKKFLPIKPKSEQDDYTRLSKNIKFIDDEAYIVGHLRKVFKRTGVFEWIDLTDPDEHPNLFEELAALKAKNGNYGGSNAGFSAIDGFSGNDIYAAGRGGDAWHYDGNSWRRLDLPGNFDIKTVTCGGDGNVYFAGYTGGVIRGTIDHWTNIDERGGKVINEMAWFQDKLYLSDERYLYTLEGGKLKPYKYPKDGPQQYSFRGVAASKDALVAYGSYQALVFDGQQWEEVISTPALSGDG
ncbi:MAG: hypothetical protein MI754_17955 [Chromatiales bacterium]|nr:hypothetical protein [Chromatiales bacterium]